MSNCPSSQKINVKEYMKIQIYAYQFRTSKYFIIIEQLLIKTFIIISDLSYKTKAIKPQIMTLSAEYMKQYIPPTLPSQRYYTLREVCEHNTANDCWVVLFGEVYDLTKLIQQNIQHVQSRPIINAAGTDITFWFDYSTRQPRVKVNAQTGNKQFYCPQGKYLHLQTENEIKWWKDQKNILGKLTNKSRLINLTNMITDQTNQVQVPSQQTINEILTRYKKFNKHGGSYIWKRLGRPLDMQKTLDENGIYDQDRQFEVLGIEASKWYIPTVHLFFNDDLTVA